ncbi:DUF1453 domain-containing protein [Dyella sp.]|uniref:DUF1453 domain-containing protein n=1 Tax=Dyella sp. TaxID=1869338 RepID=UPI002ED4B0D4
MTPQMVAPMIMGPLIAFMVWRRVRRTFGPQPVQRRRMMFRIAVLLILGGLISLSGLRDIRLLEGMLGGVLAGAALGVVGLRLTRFERNAAGEDVYIPNPWIGGLLTALLVGRLIWRFATVGMVAGAATPPHAPPLGNSPLTLLVFGLTVGYYVAYFIGLLIHHRRFEQTRPMPPPLKS